MPRAYPAPVSLGHVLARPGGLAARSHACLRETPSIATRTEQAIELGSLTRLRTLDFVSRVGHTIRV